MIFVKKGLVIDLQSWYTFLFIAHVTVKISCLYARNNFFKLTQTHKKSENLSY